MPYSQPVQAQPASALAQDFATDRTALPLTWQALVFFADCPKWKEWTADRRLRPSPPPEPGNEPGARRTRRRSRPVDRLQTIGIALVLGDIEPDEPPSFDIFAHHRLGHVAPAGAFLQQHVLRAKIGQAPSVGPDHAVVLALCDWRAVGQHKLDVVARGAWRIPARECQRMIGSSDGISSTLPTPLRSISGTCA